MRWPARARASARHTVVRGRDVRVEECSVRHEAVSWARCQMDKSDPGLPGVDGVAGVDLKEGLQDLACVPTLPSGVDPSPSEWRT